jgi:hypothetical protein
MAQSSPIGSMQSRVGRSNQREPLLSLAIFHFSYAFSTLVWRMKKRKMNKESFFRFFWVRRLFYFILFYLLGFIFIFLF